MLPTQTPPTRPALDPSDLSARWVRARGAALDRLDARRAESPEALRLRDVPIERREALLREVGRNSWRLGRSVAQAFGAVDEAERLGRLLEASGIPCARGERITRDEISICGRSGCPESGAGIVCDFYREALDGFVCGVSERLRYSRRRRVAAIGSAGADRCEDVLYPAEQWQARFEPLPAEVDDHLSGPLERLAARGVALELLGMTENRVHLRAASGRSTACGSGKIYFDLLAAHLAARFPDFELVDASPRAVLA